MFERTQKHFGMVYGDDWAGWANMLDDCAHVLCGFGVWGLQIYHFTKNQST